MGPTATSVRIPNRLRAGLETMNGQRELRERAQKYVDSFVLYANHPQTTRERRAGRDVNFCDALTQALRAERAVPLTLLLLGRVGWRGYADAPFVALGRLSSVNLPEYVLWADASATLFAVKLEEGAACAAGRRPITAAVTANPRRLTCRREVYIVNHSRKQMHAYCVRMAKTKRECRLQQCGSHPRKQVVERIERDCAADIRTWFDEMVQWTGRPRTTFPHVPQKYNGAYL